MFEQFWEMYPRKVSKREAFKAWMKMKEPDKLLAVSAIENHIKYWELKGTEKEFIPHPSTWINQGRWEDELDMEPKKAKVIEQAWWSSNESMLAKGRELGTAPRPGEDWFSFKGRLIEMLKQVA